LAVDGKQNTGAKGVSRRVFSARKVESLSPPDLKGQGGLVFHSSRSGTERPSAIG
jgi:hypothetical protein